VKLLKQRTRQDFLCDDSHKKQVSEDGDSLYHKKILILVGW